MCIVLFNLDCRSKSIWHLKKFFVIHKSTVALCLRLCLFFALFTVSMLIVVMLIKKISVLTITTDCGAKTSHRRCSIRKGVLRYFTKFTGKHLCQSIFINKVAGLDDCFCRAHTKNRQIFYDSLI